MKSYLLAILFLLCPLMVVHAGEADVVAVEVIKLGDDTYRFEVTVSHSDEGWKHYADKWDVVGLDGTVFGTRTLYHPHVDEQPFRRSLSGVKIPKGTGEVKVRAHDLVHEYGGEVSTIVLPR